MNKFLKVLVYIFIGILLLPMIAIGLYIAVGGALFLVLYIINRKKNGPLDAKGGKNYKMISTLISIVGLLVLVFIMRVNFISWQGYLWVQLLVFISFLPMCYYLYTLMKYKE